MAQHKLANDCRWDYESYTCSLCTTLSSDADLGYHVTSPLSDDWLKWKGYYESLGSNATFKDLYIGLCGVVPTASYSDQVPKTRDECWDDSTRGNVRPSIGNDGRFCVCVEPNESFDVETAWTVSAEEIKLAEAEYVQNHEEAEEDTSSIDDVYELWQSDFEHGTYRILKSGTYKIMQDIVFDFNAGDLNDPNIGTSWWPTSVQQAEYPGAGGTRGILCIFKFKFKYMYYKFGVRADERIQTFPVQTGRPVYKKLKIQFLKSHGVRFTPE